jgi:hypothetical protein
MGRCLNAGDVKAWIEHRKESTAQTSQRKPALSSILTISAPTMLLSASLNCFLAGFGAYLGLMWTKGLDEDAIGDESRNVFFVYVIGLGVCYGIYTLSVLSQGQLKEERSWDVLLKEAQRQESRLPLSPSPGTSTRDPQWPHSQDTSDYIQMAPLDTTNIHSELVQALLKMAKLRKESATIDTHLAALFTKISQLPQSDSHIRNHRHRGAEAGTS